MSDPQPGQYISLNATSNAAAGERVQVTHTHAGQVHLIRLDHAWSVPAEAFDQAYAPHPDGAAAYHQEVAQATQVMTATSTELTELSAALTGTHLSLTAGGHLLGHHALLAESGESPTADTPTALQQLRATALRAQLRMQDTQRAMRAHQEHLNALTREAIRAAQAHLEPIKAHLARLEETVWTLELYAGQEERVITLRLGEPAPSGTPISVRQTVLAMDEESALRAEYGGIDHRHVQDFDAWLTADPSHLDQLLPEPKGVVALMPRRKTRLSGNPEADAQAKLHNTRTHFLIRNGENLHRVETDFHSGRLIVPHPAEFNDLFMETTYDQGRAVRTPMTPGSAAFLAAEQRADQQRRHYYRVALILQGLLDRTALLHPLPAPSMNLTSPAPYEAGYIRVIEDTSMALPDQQEPFRDWLRRVNADLRPGQRIIGHFYEGPFTYTVRRANQRFSPDDEHRPPPQQPLTISGQDGQRLFAYFPRQDMYSDRPLRRGRVFILPTDPVILALDHPDVTPAQLRQYLNRRQDRTQYATLVPLLETALAIKDAERAAEQPLIERLTAQARDELHAPDAADLAERAVAQFRTRRLAYRPAANTEQIYAECADLLRRILIDDRLAQRESETRQEIREELLARHPDALLIVRRRHGYAVAEPHRADEHVYARVTEYSTPRPTLQVTATREWSTLSRSWLLDPALHRAPRADTWEFSPGLANHFTDPEWQVLTSAVLAALGHAGAGPPTSAAVDCAFLNAVTPGSVVAVTGTVTSGQITLYTNPADPAGPAGPAGPALTVDVHTLRVQRKATGYVIKHSGWPEDRRWRHVQLTDVLWADEARVNDLNVRLRAAEDEQARDLAAKAQVGVALEHLRKAWRAAQRETLRDAFLVKYGSDAHELWTQHASTLSEAHFSHHPELYQQGTESVYRALYRLARAGVPLTGLTLEQAWTQVQADKDLKPIPAELAPLRLPDPAD